MAKLRPQSSGCSDLRPKEWAPCGEGTEGRTHKDRSLRHRVAFRFPVLRVIRGNLTPGPHRLKHPLPKFSDWEGRETGSTDSPSEPSLGTFSEFPVGKGAPWFLKKRIRREKTSFIAASPPPLPIFDREGEGLEDLVVMATPHTSILPGPQWVRE